MRQINLNVTAEFERDLRRFMKERKLSRKSDAIRVALHEAATSKAAGGEFDFRPWLGLGLRAPLRRKRRFRSEDDLWS